MLKPGTMIGRYRIERLISRGGMADVWLASRVGAGGFARNLALKIMHDDLVQERGFVDMFLDEARLTASLDHPNIVRGFDVDVHEGVPFLVMDLVIGTTWLHAVKRAHELEESPHAAVAAWIGARIASALHYAHNVADAEGPRLIIHRDVTPSNVLLATDGTPKLIDFGVARSHGRISQETEVGTLKGKVRFMAPEQLRQKDVDHRVDQYGLGVSLYFASLHRYPYDETNTARLLVARMERPPTPPHEVEPRYPHELAAVVMKLMAPNPDDRYPDMAAVSAALEAFATSRMANRAMVAGWFGNLFDAEASGGEAAPPAVTLGGLSRSDPYALGSRNPSTPVLALRESSPGAALPMPALTPAATASAERAPQAPVSHAPVTQPPASGPNVWLLLAAGVLLLAFAIGLTAIVVFVQPNAAAPEMVDASARETLRIVRSFADAGSADAGLEVLAQADRVAWTPEQLAEGASLEARLRVQRGTRKLADGDVLGAQDDARSALVVVPQHPEASALLTRALSPDVDRAPPPPVASPAPPTPKAEPREPEVVKSKEAARPTPTTKPAPPPPAPEPPKEQPVVAKEAPAEPTVASAAPPSPPPVAPAPAPAAPGLATTLSSIKVDVSGGEIALRARTTGAAVRPLALQMTQNGEGVVVVRLKSTGNDLPFQSLPIASDLARQLRVVEKGDTVEVTFAGVPPGVKVEVVPTATGFDVVLAGGS